MTLLMIWLVGAVLVGYAAESRRRSALGWFALALLLSPLLAGLILLLMAPVEATAGRAGKTCPQCAERVQREAKVCRYCGFGFPVEDEQPEAGTAIVVRRVLGIVALAALVGGIAWSVARYNAADRVSFTWLGYRLDMPGGAAHERSSGTPAPASASSAQQEPDEPCISARHWKTVLKEHPPLCPPDQHSQLIVTPRPADPAAVGSMLDDRAVAGMELAPL